MRGTLTFIDSGVLIAAARGEGEIATRAIAVLDDPAREFASSALVRLEVLPKALYNKRTAETEFYEAFFSGVSRWAHDLDALAPIAFQIAAQHGLAAMDALHVAGAVWLGADELITTEQPSKPIHRITACRIVTIHT